MSSATWRRETVPPKVESRCPRMTLWVSLWSSRGFSMPPGRTIVYCMPLAWSASSAFFFQIRTPQKRLSTPAPHQDSAFGDGNGNVSTCPRPVWPSSGQDPPKEIAPQQVNDDGDGNSPTSPRPLRPSFPNKVPQNRLSRPAPHQVSHDGHGNGDGPASLRPL